MRYNRRMFATPSCAYFLAMIVTGNTIAEADGSLAKAQTPPAVASEADRPLNTESVLFLPQVDGLTATIVMDPDTVTTWYFLDRIVSHVVGNKVEYKPNTDEQRKRLYIQPEARTSATNLNVETKIRASFLLVPARPGEVSHRMVIIVPPEPETDTAAANGGKPSRRGLPTTTSHMNQRFEVRGPKSATFAARGYELSAHLSAQVIEGPFLKFQARLRNIGKPFPVKELEVLAHAEADESVPAVIDWQTREAPDVLGQNEEVTISILIPDADLVDDRMALRLVPSSNNVFPATFDFTDEHPSVGRLSLQVEGVGGAISLESITNPNQSAFTTLAGVGGRMVYDFNQRWSVEGTLSVLFTQLAEFDDGSTAEATTARALIGGVLRFGETTVPYLRAGIGGRLSSYTLSAEEDSKLRGSALVHFGGGVDYWFGKGFVVGVSAQYIGALGAGTDESFSIEAGAHAGFAWKP